MDKGAQPEAIPYIKAGDEHKMGSVKFGAKSGKATRDCHTVEEPGRSAEINEVQIEQSATIQINGQEPRKQVLSICHLLPFGGLEDREGG